MANLTVTLQTLETAQGGGVTGNPIILTGGAVSSIPVIVKDAAGTNAITGLGTSNFTVKSASAPTIPVSGITITEDPDTTNKAGYYVINFPTSQPDATKYLLIDVSRTTGVAPNEVVDSGSLFLDPSSQFDGTGITVINYPVSFGNQKFVLGQVNQSPILNTMSNAFNFVKAANGGNCAITVKGANPLQSIVIPANGTLIPLEVTVKDAGGNAISGPQSVTVSSEIVPL